MSQTNGYKFFGDASEHRPLRELLPLSTPLSIHIDPTNACNLRCQFCPTGHPSLLAERGRRAGQMSLPLFRKIIDDLARFPDRLIRVHLYKDGEPLLNPNLAEMVAYATSKKVARFVETTTNGTRLSAEWGHALAEAGLSRIRISIQHVSDDGYFTVALRSISYLDILQRVTEFYDALRRHADPPRVHVKLLDTGLGEEDKKLFLDDFAGVADELHIDHVMGWNHPELFDFTLHRAPTTGMDPSNPLRPDRSVCPQPFFTLAVNSNGLVSACCVDWAQEVTIGDAAVESLSDIWGGERLHDLRALHLQHRRSEHPACGSCQYVLGLPLVSDLDADAARLKLLYVRVR
jgi:MoaA/NifB/PqqE/SkfB family radical SAM enzyme